MCVCMFASYSYLIDYRLQGDGQVTLSNNLHHVINAAGCQGVATKYSVSLPGQTKQLGHKLKKEKHSYKAKISDSSQLISVLLLVSQYIWRGVPYLIKDSN